MGPHCNLQCPCDRDHLWKMRITPSRHMNLQIIAWISLVVFCAAAPLNSLSDDRPFNPERERLHFSRTLRATHSSVEKKYTSMLLKNSYEALKRDPTMHPRMAAQSKKPTEQERKLRNTSVKNLVLDADRALKTMTQRAAQIKEKAEATLRHASYDREKMMKKAIFDSKAKKAEQDLKKPEVPLVSNVKKEQTLHARVKHLATTFSGQCKYSQQKNHNEITRIQKVLRILNFSKKKANKDLTKISDAANKAIAAFGTARKKAREASLKIGPGLNKNNDLVRVNQTSKAVKVEKDKSKQLEMQLKVAHATVEQALRRMGDAQSKVATVGNNMREHLRVRKRILAHQQEMRAVCKLPPGLDGVKPVVKAKPVSTLQHHTIAEMLAQTKNFTATSRTAAKTMMADAKVALKNTNIRMPEKALSLPRDNTTETTVKHESAANNTAVNAANKKSNPLTDMRIKIKVCATAKFGLEEVCKLHGPVSQQCAQSKAAYNVQCLS